MEATLRSVARHGLNETTLASVSREAGLSQGVAVFYFESKDRLLAAAFRHHYEVYRGNWREAIAGAGDDPAAQLAAVTRADFSPVVFEREALAVWYAYWGEATARPIYARISTEFDRDRHDVVSAICARAAGCDLGRGGEIATSIDALTDGLWLRAHLAPEWQGPDEPLRLIADALGCLLPGAGERVARMLAGEADGA